MRLRVDIAHDFAISGGKAVRFEEGDAYGFLGWGHMPTLVQQGRAIPEQFTRAKYACDLEVFDDGVLVLHRERAFRTLQAAKAWFRYAAWCLVKMSPTDVASFHSQAWKLT